VETRVSNALPRHRSFLPLIGGLIVLAWIALALWEQSPYGRYLDHGRWTEIGLAAALCQYLPAGPVVLPALLYVGGFLLMTAAMMLPTTLPLIHTFSRVVDARRDRGRLIALLILGYLAIWTLFGVAAHLLDSALHALVATSPWLTFNGWVIGAGVLALAGAFQFSAFKYRCLDRCRTPFSFVNQYWRGRAAARSAFVLGLHHGLYCVGCCWAIMLLMFVVGTGSVGWMLAIGALMAIEKNAPWGRALSAPLGIALITLAGSVAAVNLWSARAF
jgi:predicted metal-binding membrane protein